MVWTFSTFSIRFQDWHLLTKSGFRTLTAPSEAQKQRVHPPNSENLNLLTCPLISHVVLVVKNPLANAGDIRDSGLIPGGGNSNPLQYSCLENPMDRGAWWATLHRAAKSQTWLKWLSTYACIFLELLLRMLGMRRVPGIHCIAWFPDDVYVHSSQCLGDFMEIDLETQI